MSFPLFIEPQLATLTKHVPEGDVWLHEIKYDGYRMLGRLDQGRAQLLSRRAKEWTRDFPVVSNALSGLHARRAIVDGEVAAFLPDGSTSFQALQNAAGGGAVLGYALFDLLYLNEEDLRHLPLEERKARLAELVHASASPVVRFADHVVGRGTELWSTVCASGKIEGLVSKRRTSRYKSGRTTDWLKTKCLRRDEFVVGGFTDTLDGGELRGLLVGTYARGELVFAGRVGAALPHRERNEVFERLDGMRIDRPPFKGFPDGASVPPASRWGRSSPTQVRLAWVRPEMVVDVEYLEWTDGDVLRQPVLKGIVPGRKAVDVGRA